MKQKVQNDEFTKKRNARRRKIRRRRIKIFLIFFMGLALVTGVILSLTVLFPIKYLCAKGSKIYSSEQIVDASGIKKDDNLFMAKASIDKIREKLPYAESVKIERKFPDTMVIVFNDAKEYACYNIGGKFFAVSKSGFVLNTYDSLPDGVFEIRQNSVKCNPGKEVEFKKEKTKELVENIIDLLEKNGLNINYIDINDELEIKVKTENRFIVNFGTSNSLENKFAHLASMIKNIGNDKTGKINLSMWTSTNTKGTFVAGSIE